MKQAKLKVGAMLCFLLVGMLLYAQKGVIELKNPSFEDAPRHTQTPQNWTNCGFPGETEPDTHPTGVFGVTMLAQEGNTYLGLVVRDNSTWERVTQELSSPMKQGICYEFSIYLAKSAQYGSTDRNTGKRISFNHNVKLRIYGGFSPCHRQQLLAESPLISNVDWKQFHFNFHPTADYTHITFEAFYQTPNLFPYNGNLMLDHASKIAPIDCALVPKKAQDTIHYRPKGGGMVDRPDPQKDQIFLFSTLFNVNDSTINRASYAQLNKLHQFLMNNPDIVIEIGGHTSGLCDDNYCNKLSQSRAAAISSYLITKGIKAERLVVKGYGKTRPLSTVKNDPKNQRVSVKVL